MRKVLAIMVLIALAVGLYFYIGSVYEKNEEKSVATLSESKVLEKIKDDFDGYLAEVRKIQKNPDQIVELNCLMTKLLYSGTLTDEENELVFRFQRQFYTVETLEKNPEELNYERLIEDLRKFKDNDLKIIGYKIVGPQYVEAESGKRPMLIFNVIYYLNINSEEGEVFKGYVFQENDQKLWELKGFGTVDSFPIINN